MRIKNIEIVDGLIKKEECLRLSKIKREVDNGEKLLMKGLTRLKPPKVTSLTSDTSLAKTKDNNQGVCCKNKFVVSNDFLISLFHD